MAPGLQPYINEIPNMGLKQAIQTIVDLAPGLIASVSPKGVMTIHHPDYEGLARLDDLGRQYISCGHRCTDEHAPFPLRLLHLTLDNVFEGLYEAAEKELNEGVKNGTVSRPKPEYEGCACCSGDPAARILMGFAEREALYFEAEEYRQFWSLDDPRRLGYRKGYSVNPDEGTQEWYCASKEQLEEVIQLNPTNPSKL
ncbi:hypothetical protein N7462_009046 [Penicillium macrosclerotiorum]|uniref:uncharacterized protein n=1 Tax=Penicillium macrosclerotiorum TaxID=303699 RepID=UPI0025468DB3|nr:uncharacterized protein N7462_009046 [Penicillium macrosclerotiorum]KAJ5676149.1 hypothetical protein N7462_009046 [Penicillium macrosclerotiorum]